ncbi:hypothetical protein IFT66_16995 [Rhizobium sp. CFBP 13726]|uniref:hypothetical protein n=1 Tax=Rhizobium sp. CFBP 13726 TaxID=2775296 RepID=UPI00177DD2EB|nr:hypothetical protein [Rhizobium sp. CFBP 13726]MBD8652783.1 hypothetical protein [Rhizobium sp. CFBP 13726]
MNDHFAVITPSGSKRVIDFKQAQPRSKVVEVGAVWLDRPKDLVDVIPERGLSSQFPPSDPAFWFPKFS